MPWTIRNAAAPMERQTRSSKAIESAMDSISSGPMGCSANSNCVRRQSFSDFRGRRGASALSIQSKSQTRVHILVFRSHLSVGCRNRPAKRTIQFRCSRCDTGGLTLPILGDLDQSLYSGCRVLASQMTKPCFLFRSRTVSATGRSARPLSFTASLRHCRPRWRSFARRGVPRTARRSVGWVSGRNLNQI